MDNNNFGQELAKQTLDQIPQANSNAKQIVGLLKEGGRITGYQLSDNSIVEKQQAVAMAKQGQIAGVGIAHRGDTEYLKSIPDGSENNNQSICCGFFIGISFVFFRNHNLFVGHVRIRNAHVRFSFVCDGHTVPDTVDVFRA